MNVKNLYGILGSGAVSTALIWGDIGGSISTILALSSSTITVLLGFISVADGFLNLLIKYRKIKHGEINDNGSDKPSPETSSDPKDN